MYLIIHTTATKKALKTPVKSIKHAAKEWLRHRDGDNDLRKMLGASDMKGACGNVYNKDNQHIYTVHFNGVLDKVKEIEIPDYSEKIAEQKKVKSTKKKTTLAKKPNKKKSKKKVEKPAKTESMRKMTLRLIQEGKSDQDVLDAITCNFTNKKYDMTHVKWYRSTFARSEEISAEFAPKGSKIYKDWKNSQ